MDMSPSVNKGRGVQHGATHWERHMGLRIRFTGQQVKPDFAQLT
jgi:hypothetical protein